MRYVLNFQGDKPDRCCAVNCEYTCMRRVSSLHTQNYQATSVSLVWKSLSLIHEN
jgi:hypothetical protein